MILVMVAALAASVHVTRTARADEPAAAQTEDRVRAEAVRLYQEGTHAFREKRWADAEEAYLKAWALWPTYDVAANLGEVELKLGKAREAARYLAFTLRTAPPSAKAAHLERTQHFLDEAKKKVGTVRVRVSVADAEVWLDGVRVEAEEAKHEIFVDPGAHEVTVRRQGYTEAKEAFVAAPGSSQEVKITLQPAAAAMPTAAAPENKDAPESMGAVQGPRADQAHGATRSLVPPIALGAASAVSLAVAIGTTVGSNGASRDADEQRASILRDGGQCAAAAPAFVERCGELLRTTERADTLGNVARVGYVAAGALAIGAAVYLMWPRAETRAGSPVRVVPVGAATQGGIWVLGAW